MEHTQSLKICGFLLGTGKDIKSSARIQEEEKRKYLQIYIAVESNDLQTECKQPILLTLGRFQYLRVPVVLCVFCLLKLWQSQDTAHTLTPTCIFENNESGRHMGEKNPNHNPKQRVEHFHLLRACFISQHSALRRLVQLYSLLYSQLYSIILTGTANG